MAMVVDSRPQSHLGGIPYEQLRYGGPQFTNPWIGNVSPSSSTSSYPTSLAPTAVGNGMAMAYSIPLPSQHVRLGAENPRAAYVQEDSLGPLPDVSRPYGAQYASASSASAMYAPMATPQYSLDYKPTLSSFSYSQQRQSHPLVNSADFLASVDFVSRQNGLVDSSRFLSEQARNSFNDALDASRGMVAMSQDVTPRNIYGPRASHSSTDSYGFPPSHSHQSSISYYSGSVADSSTTDYSSASESVDGSSLPRGSIAGVALPPALSSMMSQFNSKVSSSTQKKHKCKICDKRFTRPSSLQTHMYSHTGEKRKHLHRSALVAPTADTPHQRLPARSKAVVATSPWFQISDGTEKSTRLV